MIKQYTKLCSLYISAFIFGFYLLCFQVQAKDPIGFYYQDSFDARMANYQQLVVNAEAFTPDEINQLKALDTKVIAYLSVGETEPHNLISGNGQGPGGYASWYIDINPVDNMPDKNPNWGSYYVNVADPAWQDYLFSQVDELVQLGISGIFLDTVDTVDVLPGSDTAMVALIKNLSQTYGNSLSIVQNRGFSVIEDTAPYIDAVLFEGLTGSYDHQSNQYVLANIAQTDALARRLNQIRRQNDFDIWSLDYLASGDTATLNRILSRAEQYQFLATTSNIAISRFDTINLNRADGLPDSKLTDFIGNLNRNTFNFSINATSQLDLTQHIIQIFINTEKGNLSYINGQIAADFLIENGALYQYIGTGNDWNWRLLTNNLLVSQSALSYSLSITAENLSLGEGDFVEAQAFVLSSDWSVVQNTDVLRMISPIYWYKRTDEVDSHLPGTQDLLALSSQKVGNDIDFTLTARETIGTSEHYGFFIDSNDLSGYRYYDISASYMIKDGHLYHYTGNGSSWSWSWLKWIPNQITDVNKIGYRISLADLNLSYGQSYEVIGFAETSDWITRDVTTALQGFVQ